MQYQIKYPFIFAFCFFWLWLIIAVSFLETPLKFQVPGMTLPIALELGKTMFGISTNIQLGLMILVFFNFFLNPSKLNKFIIFTGVLLALILVLEKFWMLPILDARADVLATGKGLPPTPLHNYFIYAECIKVILLLSIGFLQLKKII